MDYKWSRRMITLKPRKPKKLLKSIEQNDNDSYSLSLNYGYPKK